MRIEIGTLLKNTYKILQHLGRGAMGNVYLALDTTISKKLVLKELIFTSFSSLDEESAKKLFLQEAEIMERLTHSGLPDFYEKFTDSGRDFLVMEYIEGKTLEEKLSGSINLGDAIKWTIELSEILDYLHNSFNPPIIFKDLKPSNIIITPSGSARLIDFGISRFYDP